MRRRLVVTLLAVWLAVPAASAGAQDAPAVQLRLEPARLDAGGQPVDVVVLVENAPPLRGFEIVLGYDPDALVITGAVAGALLGPSGTSVVNQAAGAGELRLSALVATDDAALRPQGTGALAVVSLGALAGEGTWELQVRDLELIAAGEGDAIGAADVGGTAGAVVEVVAPADEEARAALVAAGEAFAEAAAAPPGPGATLSAAFADLRARLGDEASAVGPLLAWLGALAAGALVALAGWWLGRDADEAY